MTDVDIRDVTLLEDQLGQLHVLVVDLDAPGADLLPAEALPPDRRVRFGPVVVGDPAVLMVIALVGMASVYLINGFIAIAQPGDFTTLVDASLITQWLGMDELDWITALIAVNDLALGVLLLAAIPLKRWRYVILAWSGMWLFAITMVKFFSLDVIAG
jgi:hypothetical protein